MAAHTFTMVELFSGLGSQNRAFCNVSKRRGFQVDVKAISEWNIHALVAYDLIHFPIKPIPRNINSLSKEELVKKISKLHLSNDGSKTMSLNALKNISEKGLKQIYFSVKRTRNLSDITKIKGESLPNDLDILTYSFPCQDLSSGGFIHGFKNGIDRDKKSRSGLLWQVERLLMERIEKRLSLPKFLVMENVISLDEKRHRNNFNEWKLFLEKNGYFNKVYKLDAINFGVPQKRVRIIMVSTLLSNEEDAAKLSSFFASNNLGNIKNDRVKLSDYLITNYFGKYLTEAKNAQPNATTSREKIWGNNSVLLNKDGVYADFSQTITTKQDRHPNSGNIYFDYPGNTKSKFRYLTPRECFLLMGFEIDDIDKLIDNDIFLRSNVRLFSNTILYKLAGNSIVINVLEAIFDQIIDIFNLLYLK